MDVHLTNEQERLVLERIASGDYESPNEVIEAGLKALEAEERWRSYAEQRISNGMAQAKAGELLDGEAVFQELFEHLNTFPGPNS